MEQACHRPSETLCHGKMARFFQVQTCRLIRLVCTSISKK
jgi:hypothetical protein